MDDLETTAKIEAKRQLLSQVKELKSVYGRQQASDTRDHLKGWSAFRIYEKIKHMKFPPPQHLLDEISNLEMEQEDCDLEGNPAPDAPSESSSTFRRKDVPKED
ncbi:S2-RNase [Pyrus ussuriensis x Pyrus communis]|uniref:S2-RNase n=1 Tax=Pyrus ussuriensis x Pyrus communis TaxID=2448454 RepID=A0A5N5GJ53_9ROSA|nr:S2-RNase [Pyrus ussuriensis x Pyrus communis]